MFWQLHGKFFNSFYRQILQNVRRSSVEDSQFQITNILISLAPVGWICNTGVYGYDGKSRHQKISKWYSEWSCRRRYGLHEIVCRREWKLVRKLRCRVFDVHLWQNTGVYVVLQHIPQPILSQSPKIFCTPLSLCNFIGNYFARQHPHWHCSSQLPVPVLNN